MDYNTAIKQAMANKAARAYPSNSDPRSRNGTVFPNYKPKFKVKLSSDQTIFTIGSCFARNIEEALFEKDVFFPTRTFSAPKEEWPGRPNGLLNEFTPATIVQRILYALDDKEFPNETIVKNGELYSDLLLLGGSDVTYERALERRKQIRDVYKYLCKSDLVILTLGYVEAWFDEETKLFLNRVPPHAFAAKNPHRFVLKRLEVYDCVSMLRSAFERLAKLGIKTLLTVSPVPLNTTFTFTDCVIANEFSKSVLRASAERFRGWPLVDYFPSYEIVRSCGMPAYGDDQIHVRDKLVREVTKHMISIYENTTPG